MSRLIHNCQWCGDTLGGDNPCGCPASREISALRQRVAELERELEAERDESHRLICEAVQAVAEGTKELSALREELQRKDAALEAERDALRRATGDNRKGDAVDEITLLKRELSALREELQRKDAALKEALEFLPTEGEMRDEASLNEGRASRAGIVGAHVRAALQPKEPPCKA